MPRVWAASRRRGKLIRNGWLNPGVGVADCVVCPRCRDEDASDLEERDYSVLTVPHDHGGYLVPRGDDYQVCEKHRNAWYVGFHCHSCENTAEFLAWATARLAELEIVEPRVVPALRAPPEDLE